MVNDRIIVCFRVWVRGLGIGLGLGLGLGSGLRG